jgi:hypothetical protein
MIRLPFQIRFYKIQFGIAFIFCRLAVGTSRKRTVWTGFDTFQTSDAISFSFHECMFVDDDVYFTDDLPWANLLTFPAGFAFARIQLNISLHI